MQAVAIVLLCVGASTLYGVLHDQVTVRVCLEYFTVFHPPLVDSTEPTVVALAWGVAATWWVGALLGVPLAVIARAGAMPKRSARSLVRPVAVLMAVCGALALVTGLLGYVLVRNGAVEPTLARSLGLDQAIHARFTADLWAHNMSYWAGFVGGFVLWVMTWWSRYSAMRRDLAR